MNTELASLNVTLHANERVDASAQDHKYAYYALTRDSKSKPWKCVAWFWSSSNACLARAQDHFAGNNINHESYRIVMQDDWLNIQTRQHLKSLKIK